MLGKFDLHALDIAVTAIAEGSMSAAAARLGLTQSAVSQAVRRAEAQFGTDLIYRDCRPYRPTKAGQMLARELPLVSQKVEQMVERVREAAAQPERFDLRLGMIDTFASTVGPLLLRELMDGALALQISALSGLAAAHADAMKQHLIDAAVTSETLLGDGNLDRFALYREPFVLACARERAPQLEGRPLKEILAANRLIQYSARSHMGRQIDRHLQRMGCDQERVLAFDTSDSLMAMVARDVGVAVTTPLCILHGGMHRDALAVMPLPGPRYTREIALYVRRGELTTLGPRIAEMTRALIRDDFLPQIVAFCPWLADEAAEMVLD